MDVQNLAVYTFAAKQSGRESDHSGVIGAQYFLHDRQTRQCRSRPQATRGGI